MSYDLFFYKHKNNNITQSQIAAYLSENLTPVNKEGNQWFFENKDTEVYYIFETNEPAEITADEEMPEGFADFEDAGISFILNFIRPHFFGIEAFNFVERFIQDLDLFVLNPQGTDEVPIKPAAGELFENWSNTNEWASKEHTKDCFYYPLTASNEVWAYNFKRQQVQEQIGREYFVSRIFFFEEVQNNKAVTVSMWTEHIPNVLPLTDYYLLGREQKKLFRTVKDKVLLPRNEFNAIFGNYFKPYTIPNTIIIHPQEAASVQKLFNNVKSVLQFESHLKRIAADSITNFEIDE